MLPSCAFACCKHICASPSGGLAGGATTARDGPAPTPSENRCAAAQRLGLATPWKRRGLEAAGARQQVLVGAEGSSETGQAGGSCGQRPKEEGQWSGLVDAWDLLFSESVLCIKIHFLWALLPRENTLSLGAAAYGAGRRDRVCLCLGLFCPCV